MSPNTEYVNLPVSDGTTVRAYVSRPAGQPRGGLIVLQEAFGVNAHIRDVTDRFAHEGYLAIAPELFHRTQPGFETGYADFSVVVPHMKGLTDAGIEADLRAAYEWLQKGSGHTGLKISAIGYCMGGRCAMLAAISLPLASAVSYYGGGMAGNQFFGSILDRMRDVQAPLLLFWGGEDHHISPEQKDAVHQALEGSQKRFTTVEFSFADHGFFCDARPSYSAEAAAQAWPVTLAFLAQHTR